MEKCNEKLVLIESFDQNNSTSSTFGSKSSATSSTTTTSALHDDNLIYQQFQDLNIDENIILCWENYSVPLQDVVKSLLAYDKNMIEYYRYLFEAALFDQKKIQKKLTF